jgi:hypothetical protein
VAKQPHISHTVMLKREFVSSRVPVAMIRAYQTPLRTELNSRRKAWHMRPQKVRTVVLLMDIARLSSRSLPPST